MSKKQKQKEIVFVNDNSGDWMGLYVDGKLVSENHSLEPDDVLSLLGIEHSSRWIDMEDSRLPSKLSDIKEPEKPYVFDPKVCKNGKPHESIMGGEFCCGCGEPL